MEVFYLLVVAVIFFTALAMTEDGIAAFLITAALIWLAPDVNVNVDVKQEEPTEEISIK